MKNKLRIILPVLAGLLYLAPAHAGVFTWTGSGTTNNWSDGGNWLGGLAPANDGTADLVFGPSSRHQPVVNTAWSVHGITFADNATFYNGFSGSTLTIGAGGITNNNDIAYSTEFDNMPITLAASQSWIGQEGSSGLSINYGAVNLGSYTLSLSSPISYGINFLGRISGSGGLSVTHGNTFLNYEAHDYTGGTSISAGASLWGNPTSIHGAIALNGGGRIGFYAVGVGNNGTFHGAITGGGTVQIDGVQVGFDPADSSTIGADILLMENGTLAAAGTGSLQFGTLDLSSWNGVLDLNTGASQMGFATSSGNDWSGHTITVSNYTRGSDSLRFGTNASGLTPTQLNLIHFADYGNVTGQIDANGYVTPVPEPSAYAAAISALCALGILARRRAVRRA